MLYHKTTQFKILLKVLNGNESSDMAKVTTLQDVATANLYSRRKYGVLNMVFQFLIYFCLY